MLGAKGRGWVLGTEQGTNHGSLLLLPGAEGWESSTSTKGPLCHHGQLSLCHGARLD